MSPPTRTVVITGGTGGIGFQSALGIAKAEPSTKVVITGRNLERGQAAQERLKVESKNDNIQLVIGDVSSIAKVDALAGDLSKELGMDSKIDVLVNNAGYLGSELLTNEDGLENHFAINVVAPYRLTHQLLPLLTKSKEEDSTPRRARVINVTGGDKPIAVDIDNLQAEKGFKGLMTYTDSKSALEGMSMALARELKDTDIQVNVVFPGRASTAMTQSLSTKTLPGMMKLFYPIMKLIFREDNGESAAKAAQSTIWAALAETTELLETGKYYDSNCKETPLHKTTADPEVQDKIVAAIKAALPTS